MAKSKAVNLDNINLIAIFLITKIDKDRIKKKKDQKNKVNQYNEISKYS